MTITFEVAPEHLAAFRVAVHEFSTALGERLARPTAGVNVVSTTAAVIALGALRGALPPRPPRSPIAS